MSSIDQQFVEFIAKSLVSQPDEVVVERRIDERGVLLELTVAPEDLGRVIGKHGATAQSLRTLLRALGTKNDARYNLKIVDTDQPAEQESRKDKKPVVSNEHADPAPDTSSAWSDDSTKSNDDSDDDQSSDQSSEDTDAKTSPVTDSQDNSDHEGIVSKTRKELAELDDLDV